MRLFPASGSTAITVLSWACLLLAPRSQPRSPSRLTFMPDRYPPSRRDGVLDRDRRLSVGAFVTYGGIRSRPARPDTDRPQRDPRPVRSQWPVPGSTPIGRSGVRSGQRRTRRAYRYDITATIGCAISSAPSGLTRQLCRHRRSGRFRDRTQHRQAGTDPDCAAGAGCPLSSRRPGSAAGRTAGQQPR